MTLEAQWAGLGLQRAWPLELGCGEVVPAAGAGDLGPPPAATKQLALSDHAVSTS